MPPKKSATNPKGAGRPVLFNTPSQNYHFNIPDKLIEEFREIYKRKTKKYLNK